MLAREAHQLREETADDAVLAADISDTDYAQLLVGVARHECPGLLLGAHGVAPSKSSLARRVARVLDGKSVRGPAARSFALGVFVGAVLVAAPLAALTLAPAGTKEKQKAAAAVAAKAAPQSAYYAASDPVVPTDLGSIIADGVTTSVQAAVAAAAPAQQQAAREVRSAAITQAIEFRQQRSRTGARASGRRRSPTLAGKRKAMRSRDFSAAALQAAELTPEYIGAIRASGAAVCATGNRRIREHARGRSHAGLRSWDGRRLPLDRCRRAGRSQGDRANRFIRPGDALGRSARRSR